MTPGATLWSSQATDVEGTATFLLRTEPDARLGVVFTQEQSGQILVAGLSLDRRGAQALRHAITAWLVDAAPEPVSP